MTDTIQKWTLGRRRHYFVLASAKLTFYHISQLLLQTCVNYSKYFRLTVINFSKSSWKILYSSHEIFQRLTLIWILNTNPFSVLRHCWANWNLNSGKITNIPLPEKRKKLINFRKNISHTKKCVTRLQQPLIDLTTFIFWLRKSCF